MTRRWYELVENNIGRRLAKVSCRNGLAEARVGEGDVPSASTRDGDALRSGIIPTTPRLAQTIEVDVNTPTKEELGLPWFLDMHTDFATQQHYGLNLKEKQFTCHAANTYHERERLLRDAQLWIECDMAIDSIGGKDTAPAKKILDRLHEALKE